MQDALTTTVAGSNWRKAQCRASRTRSLFERCEMNPDIQLRHEVFAQLNWDPAVFGCDVDVRVKDGVVTLQGKIASESLKLAVERAVRRAEGVTTIVNKLIVAADAADCANGAELPGVER
jgi:osmotically-inducible protein OsmY